MRHPPGRPRAVTLAAPAAIAIALVTACAGSLELTPSDAATVLSGHHLDHPNPALPGPHGVLTLYYGSGTDKNRLEYRDSVAIVTETVDASTLVSLGASAESRNSYWGFSPDSFPINARVWYPDDPGPHPLVLVVHGNHNMRDFSDPGYDWLGELLASRGHILASVDMNFINGGIRQENDGRGWLLLKHLQAWRRFNEDPDGPFHGRVDMGNIALIGHSRGGEAVALAAAFNRLTRYPDDASLEFDFGFDIKSVISIAPVDGQYLPADQRAPLSDINYLVFHGSHDGDVTSFHGLRLFNRVRFTPGRDSDMFKSAVYVYRANHGQWNTVWGAHDNGPRSARILELRGLLAPEDQREFGRVFVSAFLDITLKGDDRYRPLFRDHRVAGGWLPKTMYITRFMDSSFRPLADFEEDIDVTTGSAPGVTLHGADFSTWREGRLELRSSNRPTTSSSQLNQALWLGWNNSYRGSDDPAPPSAFTIALPAGLAQEWAIGAETTLEMHVGGLDDEPGPRRHPDADEAEEEQGDEGDRDRAAAEADRDRRGDRGGDEEKPPLQLTIAAIDADGDTARVSLTDYGPLRRPLTIRVLRRSDLEGDRFGNPWELVLQHFSIPLGDFVAGNPAFNPAALRAVALVFDGTDAGTVVVDDVGLAQLHQGFRAARVPRR
ncbi:MAG: MFS transporter [Gemmatimonadetes bacterium]|nr:MFS transporter [Gemmatimonadota bacterium]MYE93656.1 MFS transporter [Gemmatimonadota bacterium]MYJ10790.1 MFS transporter [Gemmatimonadota bacterium]